MSHEFLSPLKREDILHGLEEESGKPVFVIAEPDESVCIEKIKKHWPDIQKGAYLAFVDYNHKHIGTMKAVASQFSLMTVTIFPDSVAVVMK